MHHRVCVSLIKAKECVSAGICFVPFRERRKKDKEILLVGSDWNSYFNSHKYGNDRQETGTFLFSLSRSVFSKPQNTDAPPVLSTLGAPISGQLPSPIFLVLSNLTCALFRPAGLTAAVVLCPVTRELKLAVSNT